MTGFGDVGEQFAVYTVH